MNFGEEACDEDRNFKNFFRQQCLSLPFSYFKDVVLFELGGFTPLFVTLSIVDFLLSWFFIELDYA